MNDLRIPDQTYITLKLSDVIRFGYDILFPHACHKCIILVPCMHNNLYKHQRWNFIEMFACDVIGYCLNLVFTFPCVRPGEEPTQSPRGGTQGQLSMLMQTSTVFNNKP